MHFYSFHPGDYLRDTAHLTPMEDITYRRLLDLYYSSEAPIPLDTHSVSRRLRLDTETVDSVLNEFFQRTPEGWRQPRCDAEIAAYKATCERNRNNGKAGGRPKKTHSVSGGLPVATEPEPTGKPTRSQEPVPSTPSPHTPPARTPEAAPTEEQEFWPDPREYPTVQTVKQWAEQVMAPAACAEKWHAIRVSENWETQNGRPLQLNSLPALFRSYATSWKAKEAQAMKQTGYPNGNRNAPKALQRNITDGMTPEEIGDFLS
jgi:uncharacterized protein YdaU (DUF1376 family)